MKTKEELNALKEEVETLNKKPRELTDEELAQVSGGSVDPNDILVTSPAMNQGCYRCGQCTFTCGTIDELNEHLLTHKAGKEIGGASFY